MATSVPVKSTERRQSALRRELYRNRVLYLLFAPVFLWFLVFRYIPMFGVVIAFKDYSIFRGIMNSRWIGLKNFERAFNSPAFVNALRNTVIISFERLIFSFPAPILFALMLNELPFMKTKRTVQTVSYLPHFISWSVVGGIAYILLSPSTGVINSMIRAMGGKSINFLGLTKWFRPLIIITTVWKTFGWNSIIYLAALAGIDEELYEAAYIDGAGRFKRIWYITLPGISNITVVMLILAIGRIMNIDFEQIFSMINDMVLDVGETLEYYIYRVGLYDANNFSLATGVGLIKSVIGLVLVVTTNMISKRIGDGNGIW